jgi:cell division inhibitor SulA/protein ImuA
MSQALAQLRAHPAFWGSRTRETLSTGFAALDGLLPQGGWPLGALTEILFSRDGVGELQLLMPVLARVTGQGKWLAWVSPPHLPFGPALAARGVDLSRLLLVEAGNPAERQWALEQTLGSGACGAALAWRSDFGDRGLRRLQLAAERGGALGFLFRPSEAACEASPAALRLALKARPGGFLVRVLKGGWGEGAVTLRPGLAAGS